MAPARVLLLAGSAVDDFHAELSCLYAQGCLDAIGGEPGFDVHIAYVAPDRRWRFPAGLGADALAAAPPRSLSEAIELIARLGIDVMVPQMFCRPGMTHYRALFDVLGVPYVGNAAATMALTADKPRARGVVASAGVAVPRGEVLRRGARPTIAPPAVVKPADADNSLGVALVRERAEYDAALGAALGHADEVLVEAYVALGREVRCGILVRDGALVCLPLEEYRVDAIRRPADKLARDGDGALTLVAKDSPAAWIVDRDDAITEPVWALARRCHAALGCRDYSLFDVRVDPEGRPWFLEASLYCSFSAQSVLCAMGRAAGLSPADMLRTAIAQTRAA